MLVIEHEAACPPEFVGHWLTAEGVELDICRPYVGQEVPPDLFGYSGLVVLGGEMGANDDARYPWLTATKALLRHAVDADTPTLGICLGHQLATVALGGEVAVNPAGRAGGLTPVGWTSAADDDVLCGVVAQDACAVQWNDDVAVMLPTGSIVLATAPDGTPQAVRFADRAWGVQFHPEVGAAVFGRWAAAALERDPDDPAVEPALVEIRAAEDQLRDTWRPMVKAFAALLG